MQPGVKFLLPQICRTGLFFFWGGGGTEKRKSNEVCMNIVNVDNNILDANILYMVI